LETDPIDGPDGTLDLAQESGADGEVDSQSLDLEQAWPRRDMPRRRGRSMY
jgi:hypothetical protein